MNCNRTTVILISCICLNACAEPQEQDPPAFVVGVSPFLEDQVETAVRDSILRFVIEEVPTAATVTVQDAYNLQTIARFDLPSIAAKYDTAETRIRALKVPITRLAVWFNQRTNVAAPDGLSGTGALLAPEWLESISRNTISRPHSALLIGSPLRIDLREPAFTMIPDLYPTDGHLTASVEDSVFTTATRQGRLTNVSVYWLYPSETLWFNQLHSQRVRRFWALFVSLQGGRLGSFTADQAGFLRAAQNHDESTVGRFEIEPTDTKISMRAARAREIPRWVEDISTTNTTVDTSNATVDTATDRPTADSVSCCSGFPGPGTNHICRPVEPSEPAADASFNLTQPINVPVHIGLLWNSADPELDVDLYVKSGRHPELHYRRTRSSAGEYSFDWRRPNSRRDYEWVHLTPPVRLSEVTAWANLFKGRGPIAGRVAVHFENKTFASSFSIPASRGNGGGDATRRESSPNWTRLDIAQIVTTPQ